MNQPVLFDRDVVLLGGGLAGLCLGIQLLRARPSLRVTIVERSSFPVREAAHKVGESTVEIGGLYFADVLGLREILDEHHLPKYGLRFFFAHGKNDDIAARPEFGLRDFMPVKTWQLDRGRFENQLAQRFQELGGDLVDGVSVREVDMSGAGHTVRFEQAGAARQLRSRWVVDATGRRSFLKKQLGLARRVRHTANASWWRVPGSVDIDSWSSDASYQNWTNEDRRLSTNHLMGQGHWSWLIPLPSGGTSIGIVGDDRYHDFSSLRTAERCDAWLEAHEPQLAHHLREAGAREDFLTYRHYSYGATRVLSSERWALVGDAGFFLDPFYSPGSDFIGISNTLVADALLADLDGRPDASALAERWNSRLLRLFRSFLVVYRGGYPTMGHPLPMRAKLVWDIASYWAAHATLFNSGHIADPGVTDRVEPLFRQLLGLHVEVQNLLMRWARVAPQQGMAGERFDYGRLDWLRTLNASVADVAGDDPVDRMTKNIAMLDDLAASLSEWAHRRCPGLEPMGIPIPKSTGAFDHSWELAS